MSLVQGFEIFARSFVETKEADEVAEEADGEEDIEEKTTRAGTSDETAEGKPLKQDESVQSSIDEECPSQGWDEHAKESERILIPLRDGSTRHDVSERKLAVAC